MNQRQRIKYLIKELDPQYVNSKDARNVLRALMNVRMPEPVSPEFLRIQDEFLYQESLEKGIVSWREIPTLAQQYGLYGEFSDKISLWQGDITRLFIDAIVNAANSQMLGCFAPCHGCIDNAIHTSAGLQLRQACYEYMLQKRQENPFYEEPTGKAFVTKGYNLPAQYVIHTVGPIVYSDLQEQHLKELESCYRETILAAKAKGIRSMAFCCISTGEFHFPHEEAAKIALRVVLQELVQDPDSFDRIVFNVYKNIDLRGYESLCRERFLSE